MDLQDSDSGKQTDLLKEGRCCQQFRIFDMERSYTSHVPCHHCSGLWLWHGRCLPAADGLPWETVWNNPKTPIAKLCKAHHIVSNKCNQGINANSQRSNLLVDFIYFRALPSNPQASKNTTCGRGEHWRTTEGPITPYYYYLPVHNYGPWHRVLPALLSLTKTGWPMSHMSVIHIKFIKILVILWYFEHLWSSAS